MWTMWNNKKISFDELSKIQDIKKWLSFVEMGVLNRSASPVPLCFVDEI